ncbi:diaminopimelate decarboxylase [Marinicrinis sediminis]|uniref:Diaminopimelate decarboxylase n=1 Tax=Marinicrinis sediminis TaxID=1652465 RepID=A0ABW5RE83_9BACL
MLPLDPYQDHTMLEGLAEQYGTPFYLYDAHVIQKQIYALQSNLHPAIQLCYSLKANPNPTIVQLMLQQGLHAEICSEHELAAAISAGAQPHQMMVLGPGKSRQELQRLLSIGVKYVIAESLQELQIIAELARERACPAQVGIRVNPKSVVQGARLKMGGTARQFGIDEEQLPQVISWMEECDVLSLSGIHGYFGTRILSEETLAANFSYMLNLAEQFMDTYSLPLQYVGLGGGFGIPYYENEKPLHLPRLGQLTKEAFQAFHKRHPHIELLVESGRFLSGPAGIYVARVRYVKESQGVHFAILDGGTHQHAAAGGSGSLLKRNFPIEAIIQEEREKKAYTLTGPLCTPDDVIGRQVMLPELHPGDLIAVYQSGAYGLTFSPVLFLSQSLPRELLREQEQIHLIRDRHEFLVPKARRTNLS